MPSYCDGTTFTLIYDPDRSAQLLSTPAATILPADVATNPVVLFKLKSTSGLIDAAVRTANRYAISDLFDLITSGANGGDLLQRMNADLAFKELCDYKGYSEEEVKGMAPNYSGTLALLQQLREGDWIFDIGTTPEAGLPAATRMGLTLTQQRLTLYAKDRIWGIYNRPWTGYPGGFSG